MTTLPHAPRMGPQITAWIRAKMAEGYSFSEGTCLQQMHLAAGLSYGKDYTPSNGHAPWAIEAFDHSATAVHETDPARIPGEVYVFFRSRTPGRPGHVAWTDVPGGHLLGTDMPQSGRFGPSTCQIIERDWNMTLVGYDTALNGYLMSENPIPAKPTPKPPATKPPRKLPTRISIARSLLTKARPHRSPTDQAAIDRALHDLPAR